MQKTEFPYKVFHLDVTSPEARANSRLMDAYLRMTNVGSDSKARAAAAREIQEMGGYRLAASIDAPTATDAIMLTTAMGPGGWVGRFRKLVEPSGASGRSTSPYDILSRFGKEFLIMPLGLLSLETGEFSESIE